MSPGRIHTSLSLSLWHTHTHTQTPSTAAVRTPSIPKHPNQSSEGHDVSDWSEWRCRWSFCFLSPKFCSEMVRNTFFWESLKRKWYEWNIVIISWSSRSSQFWRHGFNINGRVLSRWEELGNQWPRLRDHPGVRLQLHVQVSSNTWGAWTNEVNLGRHRWRLECN